MRRGKSLVFSMFLALGVALLFSVSCAVMEKSGGKSSKKEAGETITVQGNVVCLIPDYGKGTVTPVIATGPCIGLESHSHVFVAKTGTVYSLRELNEGLKKIENLNNRTDVTIVGKAVESPAGWILYIQ